MKTNIRLAAITCCSVILCFFCIFQCSAQERTTDDVINAVYAFFSDLNGKLLSSDDEYQSRINEEVRIRPITRDGKIYIYAVNVPNGSWALVANEKQYKTILGYGFDHCLSDDLTDMPPALNDLLHHHMNMIDSLRKDGVDKFNSRKSVSVPHVSRSLIYTLGDSLLVKDGMYINWMQKNNNYYTCSTSNASDLCCNRVYNKFCPTNINEGCGHANVGCGAVAMGQLMNYWRWPDQAEISDTITNQFFCLCGVPSDSKHIHYYDWNHMPTRIVPNTDLYEVDNIAKLLRDCGYAAQTYYVEGGSAAMMEKIDVAMRETFRYHATYVVERPWVDVASIIKTDIDSLRPVISQAWKWEAGSDPSIHTFVVDGYNSNDMYHINWGWGDDYNRGWYDLGFNGYTGFRNFLTEIYPDCNQLADTITNPQATISSGDNMTFYADQIILGGTGHNLTIASGGHLYADASSSIILHPGFHAVLGSYAYLQIRDLCTSAGSYIRQSAMHILANDGFNSNDYAQSPNSISTSQEVQKYVELTPNPVSSIMRIHISCILAYIDVYNLNGQKMLQSVGHTDIDVSALSSGMYILRAATNDGQTYQAKFIKQ